MYVAVKGWYFIYLFISKCISCCGWETQSSQKLAEQIKSEFCSCHLLDFPNSSQLSLNGCLALSHNSSSTDHSGSSESTNFLRGLDSGKFQQKTNFKLSVCYKSHLRSQGEFSLWNQTKLNKKRKFNGW